MDYWALDFVTSTLAAMIDCLAEDYEILTLAAIDGILSVFPYPSQRVTTCSPFLNNLKIDIINALTNLLRQYYICRHTRTMRLSLSALYLVAILAVLSLSFHFTRQNLTAVQFRVLSSYRLRRQARGGKRNGHVRANKRNDALVLCHVSWHFRSFDLQQVSIVDAYVSIMSILFYWRLCWHQGPSAFSCISRTHDLDSVLRQVVRFQYLAGLPLLLNCLIKHI